jgi:hypothetical protein
MTQQRFLNLGLDLLGRDYWIFVFPDSDDAPASGTQSSVCFAVTCNVAGDLRCPILGVRSRGFLVCGASVPKAAVEENCYPGSSKDEVGLAADISDWPIVDTVPESARVNSRSECELWRGISAAV